MSLNYMHLGSGLFKGTK